MRANLYGRAGFELENLLLLGSLVVAAAQRRRFAGQPNGGHRLRPVRHVWRRRRVRELDAVAQLCVEPPRHGVRRLRARLVEHHEAHVARRRALGGARRLRRVVRDNLILAAVYNLAAVGLCFAGVVTPLVAAVLMPASSVAIVSLTAFRLTGRRLAWMS